MKTFMTVCWASFMMLTLTPLAWAEADAVEDARNFDGVISQIIERGDVIAQNYQPQDAVKASDGFSRLYFDQFESSGLEFILSMYSSDMVAEIELQFGQLTNVSIRGEAPPVVISEWQALTTMLKAIPIDELNQESWLGNFTKSFTILLREGIEAILILSLLIAFLRRSGNGDKLWLVWSGAVIAMALSVVLAVILTLILEGAGQQREMMEGVVLLISALLLFYTSVWLLSQQDSKHWQQYLQQSIQQELNHSNQSVIFFMSFAAVFREGAETLLFYQALRIDTQNYIDSLWIGAAVAAVALVVFYFSVNRFVQLFRLDYFFKATAVLLFSFAAVFTGKGIMELQAAGSVAVTRMDNLDMIPMLGFFPTVEGVTAQFAVILLYVLSIALYLLIKWKNANNAPALKVQG